MGTRIGTLALRAVAAVALLGVTLVGGTTAVQADHDDDVVEAYVETTFVGFEPYFINDEEFVTYVATAYIGDDVFGMAWFAKGPPSPLYGNWSSFVDRWEIYEDPAFYTLNSAGGLASFTLQPPLVAGSERGVGTPDPWWFIGFGRITAANADDIDSLEDVERGDRFYWIGPDPAYVDLTIFTD